jgi:release factor glutamine methyltransferase
MLVSELLREGQNVLQKAGLTGYQLDCEVLLGKCLGLSRTELYLKGAELVDYSCMLRFREYIERRGKHEPVAYILGQREFWSLDFEVNNHVLIPRPETEFLLEIALKQIKELPVRVSRCIDLCCGSGVVSVVLARELKTHVLAIDCSAEALAVTRLNCKTHKVDDHVDVLCSDLFAAVDSSRAYQLIVSNPPYVTSGAIRDELDAEVADYEPTLALDGGADGLDCIRRIAMEILPYLEPSGLFVMELGAEQAEEVVNIFSALNCDGKYFEKIDIFQDYSGRDRVLVAQLKAYI